MGLSAHQDFRVNGDCFTMRTIDYFGLDCQNRRTVKNTIMKTTMLTILTFGCMLLILGAQNLLRGSWTVGDTATVQKKKAKDQ
ncbi:hypothetical protein [Flagellimonas lutaonensis]|uniref:Uncharacterized protein n=1 Tax=Flagellimonas lutaonensis TaxID=516051 RepID=A0A0D5YRG9_9FLAO|nr:hypothetical protein [Allomuricauda lutaonensis]AKA34857.1 hypothetical protein VC82_1220 [Allomuricauda lutaonensis]